MRQNATKILKIHLSHQSKNKICVWQLCWINCERRNKSKRKFCFQQQKKICFSCLWIDAWNLVWYAEQRTRKSKSGFLSFPHFFAYVASFWSICRFGRFEFSFLIKYFSLRKMNAWELLLMYIVHFLVVVVFGGNYLVFLRRILLDTCQ